MNPEWQQIIAENGLGSHLETEAHPHAPEECGEWFHALNAGVTELEYLNLLHALVCAHKPTRILETGTFMGFGTLALAAAVKFNGFGQVVSVDKDECIEARSLAEKYGLLDKIQFVRGDSLEFCAHHTGYGFDFFFSDTELTIKHVEFDILLRRGKISRPAMALFHDTSLLRTGTVLAHALVEYLEKFPNRIELPLSRGMTIVQLV